MGKVQKNETGFSIIEVLIVLAIAGLIMVVVFLAVPALQRNARNNALSTNANNIYAGASNYLSNNNGSLPATQAAAAPTNGIISIGAGTTVNIETVEVDSSIASFQINGSAITRISPIGTVQLITGTTAKCNATASGLGGTGTNRSIALLYTAESASGTILRCID